MDLASRRSSDEADQALTRDKNNPREKERCRFRFIDGYYFDVSPGEELERKLNAALNGYCVPSRIFKVPRTT
jgi:hypothetical protein